MATYASGLRDELLYCKFRLFEPVRKAQSALCLRVLTPRTGRPSHDSGLMIVFGLKMEQVRSSRREKPKVKLDYYVSNGRHSVNMVYAVGRERQTDLKGRIGKHTESGSRRLLVRRAVRGKNGVLMVSIVHRPENQRRR